MYYKHLNGFSRAPGNGKSCWSVGDTKISFLNTLAENGPYAPSQPPSISLSLKQFIPQHHFINPFRTKTPNIYPQEEMNLYCILKLAI